MSVSHYNFSWLLLIRISIISIIVLTAFNITANAATDIIVNGDFKNGMTGWDTNGFAFDGKYPYWSVITSGGPEYSNMLVCGSYGGATDDFWQNVTFDNGKCITFWYYSQSFYDPIKLYIDGKLVATYTAGSNFSRWNYVKYNTSGLYGTHQVKFSMAGSSWDIRIANIKIGDSTPVASYTANTTNGTAPLIIQFNDTSTGNLTTWSWNFGDGSPTSTIQNATHNYTMPGVYNVTLTVSTGWLSSTSTKSNYINVTSANINTIVNGDFKTWPAGWAANGLTVDCTYPYWSYITSGGPDGSNIFVTGPYYVSTIIWQNVTLDSNAQNISYYYYHDARYSQHVKLLIDGEVVQDNTAGVTGLTRVVYNLTNLTGTHKIEFVFTSPMSNHDYLFSDVKINCLNKPDLAITCNDIIFKKRLNK